MAADAGAGVEGHEAEGLGGGRPDDLPRVDAEVVAEPRHLVGHPDVDGPERVLQELRRLRHAGRGDGVDLTDDDRVERGRGLGGVVRAAADDLRDVVRLELRVAGVDALGREGQQEVLVEPQAALLEHGQQHFVGRARVGGRLQHDELAAAQALLDLPRGGEDVGDVRLFGLPQRRRHADDDGVARRELAEVGRRVQPLGRDGLAERLGRHVADVRFAAVDRLGLARVDLEADGAQALSRELDRQRQPDVAQADDADARAPVFDETLDVFFNHECPRVKFQNHSEGSLD